MNHTIFDLKTIDPLAYYHLLLDRIRFILTLDPASAYLIKIQETYLVLLMLQPFLPK